MPELGAPELMLILLITLLVFGGSKVADIGGSLGKGIKEFKKAMKDEEPGATSTATSAATPAQPVCAKCGSANLASALFCNDCGAPMAVVEAGPTGLPAS